jgi:hypothetical protein
VDYFFEFPGAFPLLPRVLADTTPDVPLGLPLALTVVVPTLLVPLPPEVTVVLVLLPLVPFEPGLALAPPCPGLSLERVCDAPDDPPDAVDISEPDDL